MSSPIRIIHFSDLHLGLFSLAKGACFDKRLFGVFNQLLRRRHGLDAAKLQRAAERFAACQADYYICSGDISSVGSAAEFALAQKLLAPILELAGDNFYYVPGNHDAYVKNPHCQKALADCFYRLNRGRFHLDELPLLLPESGFELLLSSASKPSALHRSAAAYSQEQWQKLQALLALPRQKTFRLLLEHFPVLDARGAALSWRRRLRQAEQLVQAQLEGKFDLMLSGHIHRPYLLQRPRLCCAGSLSLQGSFALIELDQQNKSISCKLECLG